MAELNRLEWTVLFPISFSQARMFQFCRPPLFGLLSLTLWLGWGCVHSVGAQETKAALDRFGKLIESYSGKHSERFKNLTAESYLKMRAGQAFDRESIRKQALNLSHSEYGIRERAHRELLLEPVLPPLIPVSAELQTPELKWRWQKILEKRKRTDAELMQAALESVVVRKVAGLLPDLEKLVERSPNSAARKRILDTYRKLAVKSDRELLSSGLQSNLPGLRQASLDSLLRLFAAEAVGEGARLLVDPDPATRFHAARALLNLGHRPALETLAKMLDEKDTGLTHRVWRIIEATTHHELGRLPYVNEKTRQAKIRECQEWVSKNLETVELRLPLERYQFFQNSLGGHTLMAIDGEFIVELDENRKEVFRLKVAGVNGVEKMADGNFVVHSYSSRYLKIVDAGGKEIWKVEGTFNGTQLLENGNLLVSRGGDKLAVEYDLSTRKVVWKYKTATWINDADRLPDGNTIIANHGGILIVSPDQKVVWEFSRDSDSRSYLTAQPLANGNILVATSNGDVYEVNRDKKVVWEMPKLDRLQDAMKDAAGDLYVMTDKKVIQYGADKKKIWELKKNTSFGEVRR